MKSLLITLAMTVLAAAHTTTHLQVEHQTNPVGLDDAQPRFSWALSGDEKGLMQSAYQLVAYADDSVIFDSQKVLSSQSWVIYPGEPIPSTTKISWKVRTWNQKGEASPWSPTQTFVSALINAEPTAPWISFRDKSKLHRKKKELHLPPPRYYRTTFQSGKKITQAIAYASALGIYELHVNGKRVGDAYFAPGWTNYAKRAYYNTYDLTEYLQSEKNTLGAIVADGWYAGYLAFGFYKGYGPAKTGRSIYGKTPALMVEVHLTFEDGSTQIVTTNSDWKVTTGPEFEADFLMGEGYDARKELPGWSSSNYDDSSWEQAIPATELPSPKATFYDRFSKKQRTFGFVKPPVLQAYPAQPVRITQELPAKTVTEQAPGVFIFDLGQNIAGLVRLKVSGEPGQKITLRFGEMLHSDGSLMTENLRTARATDTYICKGDPKGESWTPRFTNHGFQYIEVRGISEKPPLSMITGLVMHSDTPMTSGFECSDPVVNKIFQNAIWTQRGNWIDLPTDCPQRDERMGWTGDVQIYASTAAYHADVAAFFKKWLRELEDSMTPEGYYPSYVPYPFGHGKAIHGTAWSDAGVLVPYDIWKATGNTAFFTAHWPAMTRYMNARREHDPELEGTTFGAPWGDWLNVDDTTPHKLIDICYFHLICLRMAEMARVQNLTEEATRYEDWAKTLQARFIRKYFKKDGSIEPSSQTAYVLALDCGMITDPDLRRKVGQHLAQLIKSRATENNSGMTTGFLGTKPLLPMLTSSDNHDLAVHMIQSRLYPSWGYEVKNNATTIWERWDAYSTEHGFKGHDGKKFSSMNSLSHYSFGAVTGWMMSTLAGIAPAEPGYSKIALHPHFPSAEAYQKNPDTISWIKAHHDSPQGRISVHWKKQKDDSLLYEVTVPPNTRAELTLPESSPFKSTPAKSSSRLLVPGNYSFTIR